MRLFRKSFVVKFISSFLLLVLIQPILVPYYTFALTNGNTQPEFTSYESPGSTDMVNLMTGNFNMNMPILEVPGPEGSFAVPLSYHSAIGTDQEASWAGLGWNVNVGSIVRRINQFPDDAGGEQRFVTVKNLTGASSWNKVYNHPFREDWNSETGYHGNVNLLNLVTVDFGNRTDVGVAGVHVSDHGVYDNPVENAMAIMTILSFGAGGATSGVSAGAAAAKDLAQQMAIQLVTSFATPAKMSASMSGSWRVSNHETDELEASNEERALGLLMMVPIFDRKRTKRVWIDETRAEEMYGVLKLGQAPLNQYGDASQYQTIVNNSTSQLLFFPHVSGNYSRGSASDINYSIADGPSYVTESTPTLLATDSYMVNAAGIGGTIAPYRLEVGSVSVPRDMTDYHVRFAPLPYLNDYKVPFLYEGGIQGSYYHHVGRINPGDVIDPSVTNFGLGIANHTLKYILNDYTFDSDRIRQDVTDIKKVPQGTDIRWYSNNEVLDGINANGKTASIGYIDFLSADGLNASDRANFRNIPGVFKTTFATSMASFNTHIPINDDAFLDYVQVGTQITLDVLSAPPLNNFTFNVSVTAKDNSSITITSNGTMGTLFNAPHDLRLTVPINASFASKLGAYSITATNGATYHFGLPVYAYDEHSASVKIADSNVRTALTNYEPFATSWLLTTITGPDFVDRNANGMADEGDWGYWVKFNYAKQTDSYSWRLPYSGTTVDITNTYNSYESGQSQLYYLNSIETRSHIALFLKSDRADNLDAAGNITSPPQKLDEICLISREQYNTLTSPPYSMFNYSNKISKLCKSADFVATDIRNFINKNCVKRILFNYGYDLCQGVLNANSAINPQKGKLTLTGLTIKGRNDVRLVPDYKFQYGYNPTYNSNSWDGWGMYCSGGTSAPATHTTNQNGIDEGIAWSLNKIITPTGAEIDVSYERDAYSSISGISTAEEIQYNQQGDVNIYSTADPTLKILPMNSTAGFSVGDKITIAGQVYFRCQDGSGPFQSGCTGAGCSGTYEIKGFSSSPYSGLILDRSYIDLSSCPPPNGGAHITIISNYGTFSKFLHDKKGGDLRVGSITSVNEFGKERKTRYLYTNEDGTGSGVVAQEPEYIRSSNLDFYSYLKYPETPVIYGRVSVLTGKLTNDNDYYSKQVFRFVTPDQSQYKIHTIDEGSGGNEILKLFKIEDRSSVIGQLLSVEIFDHTTGTDVLSSSSQLTYLPNSTKPDILNDGINNHQGLFTEGTLLCEMMLVGPNSYVDKDYYRAQRTTLLKYPSTLQKIVNTKDGFSSSTENLSWDLLTGSVNQKLDKSNLGIYVKTITVPAYSLKKSDGSPIYVDMGSKAYSPSNRNMLSQLAGTYVYRSDALGGELGLISGNVQTWSRDWTNYRFYNTAVASYQDEGTQTHPAWRLDKTYIWRGNYARLNDTGARQFWNTDKFDFNPSAQNSGWLFTGELKRFDHYGMPLESVDKNGIWSTKKMGYDDRIIVADASNARYNEVAFSSAEDKMLSTAYHPALAFFGGEVGLGDGLVVAEPVHTGQAALSVSSGHGFVYNAEVSTSGTYRVSVWANSPDGRIYYKLNNGSDICPVSQSVVQRFAPEGTSSTDIWYKIELIIDKPASNVLQVGVKSLTGNVIVFDDFRFQPANAAMNAYVEPPLDYVFAPNASTYSMFRYVLNNDNLFVKYETNEKGELVRTYSESMKYGVKLISESKNNLRRSTVNP